MKRQMKWVLVVMLAVPMIACGLLPEPTPTPTFTPVPTDTPVPTNTPTPEPTPTPPPAGQEVTNPDAGFSATIPVDWFPMNLGAAGTLVTNDLETAMGGDMSALPPGVVLALFLAMPEEEMPPDLEAAFEAGSPEEIVEALGTAEEVEIVGTPEQPTVDGSQAIGLEFRTADDPSLGTVQGYILIVSRADGQGILAFIGFTTPDDWPTFRDDVIGIARSIRLEPLGEAGGPSSDTMLTVVNITDETVCEVNISPTTDSFWGENALSGGQVILPNSFVTFSIVEDDYDLRAQDCSDNTLATQMGIHLAGHQNWTLWPTGLDEAEDATLVLANTINESVCYVYISPSGSGAWGDDWLGATEVILPDTLRVFTLAPGDYDVLAEDCDHNELSTYSGVPIAGVMTWLLP